MTQVFSILRFLGDHIIMGWMPRGRSFRTCHVFPRHLRPDSSVMHNFSSSVAPFTLWVCDLGVERPVG